MSRFDYLLNKYRDQREKQRREHILQSSRKEVDIHANGTSGYLVKNGEFAGRILAHQSQKSTNNL